MPLKLKRKAPLKSTPVHEDSLPELPEKVLDRKGWPIRPNARIRIYYPDVLVGKDQKPLVKQAIVKEVRPDRKYGAVVTARELETFGYCCAIPANCQVMGGKTRKQRRHEAVQEVLGTPAPKQQRKVRRK